MKTKNLLLNFSISIITLLLTIFLLELVLIIINYNPLKSFLENHDEDNLIFKESNNKNIIYENRPFFKGTKWGFDVKINSWGFRDREYTLRKGNNYRIAVIGDSITFGHKLPLEKTYSKQLEKILNLTNKPADVLNMGCSGYDVIQVISLLQEKGIQFSPDLVVYGYCLNDLIVDRGKLTITNLSRNIFLRHFSLLKLRFFQLIFFELYKLKLIKSLEKEVKTIEDNENNSYSYLINKNEQQISDNIKEIGILYRKYQWRSLPYFLSSYTSLGRIGKLRHAFDELKNLADINKFKVIIMIIPYLKKSQGGKYVLFPVHNIIRYEALRQNFIVLDMFDKMDKYGLEKLRVKAEDALHPNAKGNEIIARAIYDLVSKMHSE